MAEEMQGIMGLSNAQAPQDMGQIDPSQFSPVVESYARSNPREFGQDIMASMAQADPALVEEFTRTLMSLRLPTEIIDAMQLMVDEIMDSPEDYTEMRTGYVKEGVPEELLPMEFDPAYFAALNIALDQLYDNNTAAPMDMNVPAFAEGGIINVREIARELSNMGRNGDTMLAHITPSEARMLRRRGGSGTINPETGLPEFFLKKAFKSVGRLFKGAAKAVGSAVKAVGNVVKKVASSPLGRIALTAAAVYFMGPMAGKLGITNAALANGVNTFAANTVVNLASGQKIGDAIRGGLVAGSLAGAATSIFDGGVFGAKAGAQPALEDAALPSIGEQATAGIPTPMSISPSGAPMPSFMDSTAAQGAGSLMPPPTGGALPLASGAATGASSPSLFDQGREFLSSAYDRISPTSIKASGMEAAQKAGMDAIQNLPPNTPSAVVSSVYEKAYNAAMPGALATYGPLAAAGLVGATAMGAFTPPKPVMPSNMDQFTTTGSDLLRQNPQEFGLEYGGVNTTYAQNPYANVQPTDLSAPGQLGSSFQSNPYEGMYRGFSLPESQTMNPNQFRPQFPTMPQIFPNMTEEERRQRELAQSGIGGIQQYADGGEAYPRKTGAINGPGTGTSDSVPAMLSDGEFVFTAKAVRGMGQGSRRKGAKRMYALMKQLERKAS